MNVVENQFNIIAKTYDINRHKFIPCFDDYYVATTDFIAANIITPKRVLDLGAGTGILTYNWYRKFNSAEFVLVDIADEMLNIARKRFADISNVKYKVLDYSIGLPSGNFDCVISGMSIHHLKHEEKKRLFCEIFKKLPTGGLFVNYDQFSGGSPMMDTWFDTYWVNKLENSDLTSTDLEQWKERRKLDREISVEEESEMLRISGYTEVKCVYSNQKFAVIVAIK